MKTLLQIRSSIFSDGGQSSQLADRFEETVGEVVGGVASASSQLQQPATSMASAADQSSTQATLVTSTLGEASAGVTAAAAASDEFAMSIGEISRQAATSAELARKAVVIQADLRAMRSVTQPRAAVDTLASFVVEDGRPGAQRA